MVKRAIFHTFLLAKQFSKMKKNVNNQQVNNNGCQHVQLGGMAFFDESKCFLFAPNEHGGGEKVHCARLCRRPSASDMGLLSWRRWPF